MIVRVPQPVAEFAEERAKIEFLKPCEVVRSIMRRGLVELQAERERTKPQREPK